ncbi:TRAP transporter small permease [Pusillimonas caeni]|uniref:TRAP transporter small permease n=1 Tax=Pusillimonas caeni TaxID=1348472 RepID=UPI000E59A449|nr:TRAP transporter small permease [Pusillimonas caeni]TFL14389.1 TRAP transporter small permease [Pusillimonas caeni]
MQSNTTRSTVSPVLRLHDWITRIGYWGAIGALGAIVVSYVWEVAMRYLLDSPTSWANDVVNYLLCALVFLALPEVTRARAHIAVTVLSDLAPPRVAPYLFSLINILAFASCMFAAWVSGDENIRQFVRGITTLANTPIPQWWISVFITYGFLGSALYFLRAIFPSQALDLESEGLSLTKLG